jgi:2-dehydro-3-deoxyphosphogluconate aldolase / (4S)-4-hydroxy-2-oxoglutarate aldolase
MTDAASLRAGPVADAIRAHRLVVVLRRIVPRLALLELVDELREAGARIFEVTMDAPAAVDDLQAVREHVGPSALIGAGTILTSAQLEAARDAGAVFGVSPALDEALVADAVSGGFPFIPGALSPTEARTAWAAGATFVKLFPASAVGPSFVREVRGPMPELELIPTGGVDATNASAFLDAGAVAVGIGGAIVRADAETRRQLVASIVGGGAAS